MENTEPTKKSDRTKSTILAAARAAFTEKGYERATVRDIASRAGVDPALVMRYFGSKELLFAAAADFTIWRTAPKTIDPGDVGRVFAEHYLQVWEGGVEGLPMLLRSAASSEQAAERVREIFATQVVPAVAAVSGKAGATERAGLVASQLLGMALCRFILKLPPVANMPRKKLVDAVGKTLQRYLTE